MHFFDLDRWWDYKSSLYNGEIFAVLNANWSSLESTVSVVDPTVTSRESSVNFSAIWGHLTCVNNHGYPEIFNLGTQFFSYCAVTGFAAMIALSLIPFVLYRFFDLRYLEKDSHTLRGQFSTGLAFVAPILFLTNFVNRGDIPAPIELSIIIVGFFIAMLHHFQDGKVAVCLPELLLYWAFMSLVYCSWFIDYYVRLGLQNAWVLALATLFSLTILYLELNNSERNPSSHFDDESIFSKLTVNFVTNVVRNYDRHSVRVEDLPEPPRNLNSVVCYENMKTSLAKFNSGGKYWLLWGTLDFVKYDLLMIIIFDTLSELAAFTDPWLLQLLLTSLSDYSNGNCPIFKCYYFAILYGICPWIKNCLSIVEQLSRSQGSIKLRSAFMSLIYHKSINLNSAARNDFDSGKVMNMISVDTDQMFDIIDVFPWMIASPIALSLCFYQLWKLLGVSVFASVFIYVLFVPLSSILSQKLGKLAPLLREVADKRIKSTTNAFRNIKSLKLYAWERPYFDRITEFRKQETKVVRKWQILGSCLRAIYLTLNEFVSVSVFSCFLYLNMGTLSAELVFPALQFSDLATEYTQVWPDCIPVIYKTLNAQSRINELLKQKDHEHLNWHREKLAPRDFETPTLIVDNATISWNGENQSDKIPLDKISFRATRGDLVCIIGRVGAGKSALLKAIGGELDILSGSIDIWGSISYCSQEAWLQNYSLRDNILFGQDYEEEWYNKVIDCCELLDDTKQMEKGDLTQIGERGITLSGGQKARVALARAVYARSDILLLDDVLSAVDEHVGRQLIQKLFSINGILANRTVILATNNVKVLPHSSQIISLEDKKISELKTFTDVVSHKQSSAIYRLIEEFGHAEDLNLEADEATDRKSILSLSFKKGSSSCLPLLQDVPLKIKAFNFRSSSDTEEEEDKKKNSAINTFKRYFFTINPIFFGTFIVLIILATVLDNSVVVYLGYMTNKELSNFDDAKYYLLAFVGFVVLAAFINCSGKLWGDVIIGNRLSQTIHAKMLWNVMHAPMSFFDVTPMGRLINRFSGDVGKLDYSTAFTARNFIQMITSLVVTVLGIVLGSPILIIFIIPLGLIGRNVGRMYVPVRRKISRVTSAANSPLLSHIEESLKGQSILRTFDRTNFFLDVHDLRANYWIHVTFFSRNLMRWLGINMQMISVSLSLVTVLSLVYLTNLGLISVGYAAVINRFSKRAGGIVTSIIYYIVSIETSSVSLDRIWDFVDIDQEAPDKIEATEPHKDWPSRGDLEFKEFTARYKPDTPDVLKNISFSIKAGEKIGIVGRTGSGKSSLTLAIFRILEANKGRIEIENIDTSTLGLFDLRSRLSIIPQDAQIFYGTIRENIDPLNTVDDARLWEVLDLCHLKHHLTSGGRNLDTVLSDSGDNLSRGEAQLLCLGRALIHNSKILVLDEATASVDVETDRIVQETIRKYFSDRTIITIAHRLNTIMDSDRVIVLDYGEIKEFDSPHNLLNQKGLFYNLCNSHIFEDYGSSSDI